MIKLNFEYIRNCANKSLFHNSTNSSFQYSDLENNTNQSIDLASEATFMGKFVAVYPSEAYYTQNVKSDGLAGEGTYYLVGSHLYKITDTPNSHQIESSMDINFSIYDEFEQSEQGDDDQDKNNDNKIKFGFTLSKPHSFFVFLTSNLEERIQWKNALQSFIIQRHVKQEYEFLQTLAKTGNSKVKLAKSFVIENYTQQLNKQQMVAIKIIKKGLIYQNQKKIQNLINEVEIHQSLIQCQNILKLLSIYESDSKIYLVLEYQQGGSLNDFYKNKKKFSELELKRVIQQLLLALDFIHRKEIVHRDIKLDNIMINKKDRDFLDVRIGDFGISVKSHGKLIYDKSGTPGFCAPEVFEDKGYSYKADIFSLGVVFHNLASLKQLFVGGSAIEILRKNAQCNLQHVRSNLEGILSTNGQHLLFKLLESNPANRPTAKQALQHQWFSDDKVVLNEILQLNEWICSPNPRAAPNNQVNGKSYSSFFFPPSFNLPQQSDSNCSSRLIETLNMNSNYKVQKERDSSHKRANSSSYSSSSKQISYYELLKLNNSKKFQNNRRQYTAKNLLPCDLQQKSLFFRRQNSQVQNQALKIKIKGLLKNELHNDQMINDDSVSPCKREEEDKEGEILPDNKDQLRSVNLPQQQLESKELTLESFEDCIQQPINITRVIPDRMVFSQINKVQQYRILI